MLLFSLYYAHKARRMNCHTSCHWEHGGNYESNVLDSGPSFSGLSICSCSRRARLSRPCLPGPGQVLWVSDCPSALRLDSWAVKWAQCSCWVPGWEGPGSGYWEALHRYIRGQVGDRSWSLASHWWQYLGNRSPLGVFQEEAKGLGLRQGLPWYLPNDHWIMSGPDPTAHQHLPTRRSPGENCGMGRQRAALAWVTQRSDRNNHLDWSSAVGIWRDSCLWAENKTALLEGS